MARAGQKRKASLPPAIADAALPVRTLYAIFALSGLAGLIYEASWTRYLGLFLGHAAYAQVLVLSLFMGGMGAGALIASRLGQSRIRPLLLYGLIEATLGVFGLAFHPLYDNVTSAAYATWLPALQSDSAAMMLQWSLAAALIVPQSMRIRRRVEGGTSRRLPRFAVPLPAAGIIEGDVAIARLRSGGNRRSGEKIRRRSAGDCDRVSAVGTVVGAETEAAGH